jgi:hypothetical protein
MIRRFLAAVALLAFGTSALAQSTYTTPAGTRVQGVVPLVCDVNGINCAPTGSGGVANQVQGNVANGVADSGNPVKIGARVVNGISPFALGNRTDLLTNLYGQLMVATLSTWGATDGWSNVNIGQSYGPDTTNLLPGVANIIFNGSTWDRQRGDVNGIAVQPALSANFWSYAAAASGIVNTTTAVTVKTAAGAGVRNYVSAMQCNSEAFTTASELAIRDGAAGTVLWRGKIPTVGWVQGREMVFSTPLKGTANTLVEIVTLTASGAGAVYCNLQGYTGI